MVGQETNGAGGIFKHSVQFQLFRDVVEDMKTLCPNAWLINFANPSGMVTDSIIRYGGWEKVIGLCNVPVGAMMAEPELLGKDIMN